MSTTPNHALICDVPDLIVPNADKFKAFLLKKVCDFNLNSGVNLTALYVTYVDSIRASIDREIHLANFACIATKKTTPGQYKELVKLLLDQSSNQIRVDIPDTFEDCIAYAQWCISDRVRKVTTIFKGTVLFTDEEYLTLVLCCLFGSIYYDHIMEKVYSNIVQLAQTTHDTTLIIAAKELEQEKAVKVLSQITIIIDYKLWINDMFLQRYMFKKILDSVRLYRLNFAYHVMLLFVLYTRKYFPSWKFLERVCTMKAEMFYADRQTVDLALQLCYAPRGMENWKEDIKDMTPLARKQFFRYTRFVFDRVNGSPGDTKKLIYKKDNHMEEVTIPIKRFLQAWFQKENKHLIINLRDIRALEDVYQSEWKKERVDTFLTLNNSVYLRRFETEDSFHHKEDYYFRFPISENANLHEVVLGIVGGKQDELETVERQLKEILTQYGRCINPPISVQALFELSLWESTDCGTTKVSQSLYDEEEIEHLPENIQEAIRKMFKDKGTFDPSLKLSKYYCDDCNNAYKVICNEPEQTMYGRAEDIDRYLQSKQILAKQSSKVRAIANDACADMRMIQHDTCYPQIDQSHLNAIRERV